MATFGREAEYIVALYLRTIGWRVHMSKNSRGPADVIAISDLKTKQIKWLIQVKSSRKIPRIKGNEILRLITAASIAGGDPVLATVHPSIGCNYGESTNNINYLNRRSMLEFSDRGFAMTFFTLPDWSMIRPDIIG